VPIVEIFQQSYDCIVHRRRCWNENKPAELAPQWQSELCGEGKLRTPKYENRKSCFFLCLEFRFSDQNGGIQPEKVTRRIAGKKVCIINHLYFLAERGDYTAPFFATLFVSATSPVIAAFSVVYCRVSAVASVSAMPSSLSCGHRKCPKKVTSVTNPNFPVGLARTQRVFNLS
jgi:hypothetical protein